MRKNGIILTFCIIFLLFQFSTEVHSYICANGSGGSYGDGSTDGKEENTLEILVIEGANSFLNGYSDILSISSTLESSAIRTTESTRILSDIDNAIINMKNAIQNYELLIKTAESIPYNDIVIEKLKNFNYYEFMKTNDLNSVVFNDVQSFLSTGNVTGMYKEISSRFLKLLTLLNNAKYQLSKIDNPNIEVIWQLNESASQTLLFGQYIARVFDAL